MQALGVPMCKSGPNALGEGGRSNLGKTQNSGNETKKYLKIKDNHFLNAANCAHFAHKVAQSSA
jgi:hypothetical protein